LEKYVRSKIVRPAGAPKAIVTVRNGMNIAVTWAVMLAKA
jgi:hypothetical protein